MTWLHAGNAILSVALALGLAFELGARYQATRDQALVLEEQQQRDDSERHALLLQTDATYYHDADALGLTYFNALRDMCLKEKPHGNP